MTEKKHFKRPSHLSKNYTDLEYLRPHLHVKRYKRRGSVQGNFFYWRPDVHTVCVRAEGNLKCFQTSTGRFPWVTGALCALPKKILQFSFTQNGPDFAIRQHPSAAPAACAGAQPYIQCCCTKWWEHTLSAAGSSWRFLIIKFQISSEMQCISGGCFGPMWCLHQLHSLRQLSNSRAQAHSSRVRSPTKCLF